MNRCKICHEPTNKLFSKIVLKKYSVDYFRCTSCNFVQTSEPFWMEEAYASAITSLDIGLISRNLYLKDRVSEIITTFFSETKDMIDYGGGYGMFVRLMRDMGYNFYRQDLYCENLFAAFFDLKDAPRSRFDLLTAFEVFEHLISPLEEIEKMFKLSETIIFSTLLSPRNTQELEDWWYVSPLMGQHVSFFDVKTLEYLAQKFNKNLYTNRINLHILTPKLLTGDVTKVFSEPPKASFLDRLKNKLLASKSKSTPPRTSLLQIDYQYIEEKLTRNY